MLQATPAYAVMARTDLARAISGAGATEGFISMAGIGLDFRYFPVRNFKLQSAIHTGPRFNNLNFICGIVIFNCLPNCQFY